MGGAVKKKSVDWRRVTEIYLAAMDLPPERRAAFLDKHTSNEPDLRAEVETLIANEASHDAFLETPAIANLPPASGNTKEPVRVFNRGERVGDFIIHRVLGSGAFATVYQATQLSLGRDVALKISRQRGREAKNMAGLEHDNIVQVFSELVEPVSQLNITCMQYVSGPSLERLIVSLGERPSASLSGKVILEIIDQFINEFSGNYSMFDPGAFRDRQLLDESDFVEAILWMGARIANSLAYAHRQGIIHLDVKPANILLNPYGRPLLTDFNVAISQRALSNGAPVNFGGTFHYMAPEQLEVFRTLGDAAAVALVDHRADIYSLGVVLQEFLSKRAPAESTSENRFSTVKIGENTGGVISPELNSKRTRELSDLEIIIDKCIDREPARRFHNAGELARALEGCLEMRRIRRAMPKKNLLNGPAMKHPLVTLSILGSFPQIISVAVSVFYNSAQIVRELSPDQQTFFFNLLNVYNLILFGIGTAIWLQKLRPIAHYLKNANDFVDDPEGLPRLRRNVVALPGWIAFIATLGWAPGAIIFPASLHFLGGGISAGIWAHFMVSFGISSLIALSYSCLMGEIFVLRYLYPRFWVGANAIQSAARVELRSLRGSRLRWMPIVTSLTPLSGSLLLLLLGSQSPLLMAFLICLGIAGVLYSVRATRLISHIHTALTGGE